MSLLFLRQRKEEAKKCMGNYYVYLAHDEIIILLQRKTQTKQGLKCIQKPLLSSFTVFIFVF